MDINKNNRIVLNSIDTIFKNFQNNKKNIINEVLILNTISNIFNTCDIVVSENKKKELIKIYNILSSRIKNICPNCESNTYKNKIKFYTSFTKDVKPITLSTKAYINRNVNDKNMLLEGCIINDEVNYTNLNPSKTYTLITKLYNKTTNSFTNISKSTVFQPSSNNGTLTVSLNIEVSQNYNFYTSNIGNTFVVCQYLYINNTNISEFVPSSEPVVIHEDFEDVNQTIYNNYIVELDTTVLENDFDFVSGYYQVIDEITFTNLIPYTEYKLVTEFIDLKTGGPAIIFPDIITVFTTEGNSNFIKEFKYFLNKDDVMAHRGSQYVLFQKLYLNDNLIAQHTDMYDDDQQFTI